MVNLKPVKHFEFKILAKRGKARAGKIHTPHGVVHTPVFMPVGTQASVKALDPLDLKHVGAEIILGNTYHLYLHPGSKLIKQFGGLHGFMKWDGPILTDSGGYQVTSLGIAKSLGRPVLEEEGSHAALVKIDDDGATFRSHWDGSLHRFTPEKAIQIQKELGADIIMAFDEATPLNASHEYTKKVLERTHAWAVRSLNQHKLTSEESKATSEVLRSDSSDGESQALFGIIQGGFYKDLRRESAKFICSLPFDGIAVGGGDIGSSIQKTAEIFEWIYDLLPKEKPIYAMGVGVYPQDALDAIGMGIDMFDCVAPTRIARSGLLYSGKIKKKGSWFEFESEYKKGRLTIIKSQFKKDKKPIDSNCLCYTCKTFSRAYLHHLFKVHELLAYRLGSIHNLYFLINVVKELREAIPQNQFNKLKKE